MISNTTKYPTVFSIQNIESIPKPEYKFTYKFQCISLSFKQYHVKKIVIHSKENKKVTLNTESQSRVFLGELSYEEIPQIILEIHFLDTNLNYSFVSYFPCTIIDNRTPLLDCYNIILTSIEECAVEMIIEPIEINVDKEQQKQAEADHEASFRALVNKEAQQKEQYR